MNENFTIAVIDHPEESAWRIIGQGLNAFNAQQAGSTNSHDICLGLFSAENEIVGGVIAEVVWDWLFINVMWVREDLRGQGHGSRLLGRAEEEARQLGAKHAHLDTFSFQAPDFYRKQGYRVFGELPNFPAGQTRYFFTKEL